MRILAISHLYPNVYERRYGIFVARQLGAMAEQGADITALVPRQYAPDWLRKLRGMPIGYYNHRVDLVDVPGVDGIPIPYLGLPGAWYIRWSGRAIYWAIRSKAKQLHREKPFDVIYSTSIIVDGDAGRRLAKELDIPSASLAIGGDVNIYPKQSEVTGKHYRSILSDLEGTLACGQSLADDMDSHRASQTDRLKTLCVHGVVDLEHFSVASDEQKLAIRDELNLPHDRTVILYVGYLFREKGVYELMEAFEAVHQEHPEAMLVVCGAGTEEGPIKKIAAKSSASHAIKFVGMVEPNEVSSYMRASDVFVLPSYGEGMPNAVMEAMACGLPVVCTSVGGLTAALEHSEGSILIPSRDAAAFATAMKSVVSDAAKRETMSVAARNEAEEQFGVRRNAKRILDYLGKVIALKPAGSDSPTLPYSGSNSS